MASLAELWRSKRIAVVVAHPDDEVLGCGALLTQLPQAHVVHVTDGAPRGGSEAKRLGFASTTAYADARRREAEAALVIAGIPAAQLTSLGVADQEVSLDLVGVARALVPILVGADLVLTHAFEGGHSDHDAVAFAVHAAHRLCAPRSVPDLFEMPFYYGEDDHWVRQRFLPQPGAGPDLGHDLGPADRKLKIRMIEAHRTQVDTLRSFPIQRESIRRAPSYDFTKRPHDGPLLYECHGWNLTWSLWQSRVVAALSALGLDGR